MTAPVALGEILAGKYRVDRVLGEGGMGVVVAATDMQLERRVAIKFLLPDYAEHHEAAQRFLREARAAVKIQSEHVARVIDVGTMESGAPYMVMEYLEGTDLAGVLDERVKLPVEEAVAYVLEACDAIAEAHSVGIVHRDLKPANLFLARQPDGSGKIKVLDFGISKAMMTTSSMDPALTRTSSMMGSPLYMSPEQMRSAKHVDPRTDVWALGVILYEALCGEPPFYAESIPELSAKVLLEEVPRMRSFRPDLPEELEKVTLRALSKEPASRFPTVADFATALLPFAPARSRVNVERAQRVLKLSGTGPMPASGSVPGGKSTAYAQTAVAWEDSKPLPKKSRGATFAAVGFVAVALIGATFFLLGRTGRAPAPVAEAPSFVTQAAPSSVPAPPPPAVVPAIAVEAPAASAPPAPSASTALAAVPPVPVAPAVSRPAPVQPRRRSAPAADDPSGFGSRK